VSYFDPERLYELLPAVYRQRDADEGYPLRDLVGILAREATVVEDDIRKLYDNWFIETCEEWSVPYLGDLIGVDGITGSPKAGLSRRAEVANTLSYRQRKGTAAVLEQLARDLTGWPARAVEFFDRLATTQHLNHVRLGHRATTDLRDADALELTGSPFDGSLRTGELRRIEPRRGQFNIPNVGLFLWRLQPYPLELGEGRQVAAEQGRFTFSTLGNDTPLFNLEQTETDAGSLAAEINVPERIRRRAFYRRPEDYYGRSLGVYEPFEEGWRLIPVEDVVACDLADWERPVEDDRVAIDPVLGRVSFGAERQPEEVRLSYYHGFSADLGGGQYERQESLTQVAGERSITVGGEGFDTLGEALAEWAEEGSAVIEISDSRTYEEVLPPIELAAGVRLELRAANERRPTLLLGAELEVEGAAGSSFEVNGLLVAQQPLVIGGGVDRVALDHCTFVPGRALEDNAPTQPGAPSLVVTSELAEISIRHSILGGVRAAAESRVVVEDSILDTHDSENLAFASPDGTTGGRLTARRVTIVGRVLARELELAENCLFLAPVIAEQRQAGCVRFSHVPLGSRVPRRFRCQPEIAATATAVEATRQAARVAPRFTSLDYGDPGYCQLDWRGPIEIARGGEDGGEMGAFYSLQQPLREDSLVARLDEYLRLGLEAGIFFVT